MARELPAELLKEILSPPLLVSDDLFTDSGAVSPFSKVDKSASDVLLVCKSWMRVATPWLYSTVIVRSMAQAKALALALTNNPDFGKFIRRLRVEGAYGEHIWAAVKTAPNITDLCMTLTVWSDVPVTGLVKSLAHIDPRRVILTLTPEKSLKSKNHKTLLNALCDQIQCWTRLTTFKFAGTGVAYRRWSQTPDYIAFPSIVTALCASPNLEEVLLAPVDTGNNVLDVIQRLLADSTKRVVTLYMSPRYSDGWFDVQVERLRGQASAQFLPRIRTIAKSTNLDCSNNSPMVSLPVVSVSGLKDMDAWLPNPFYKPLDCIDSLVRRALLARIFRYALEVETPALARYANQAGEWFDASCFDGAVARVLLKASQEFESIALEILVQHVSIYYESDIERLLKITRATPTLLGRVTTFHLLNSMTHTPAQIELLEQIPRLTEATTCFSHVAIEALVRGCSSVTLRKLHLYSPWASGQATQPLNLGAFFALEELVISYPHYITPPTDIIEPPNCGLALPRLRRLRIDSAPRYILDSLTAHDLPLLEYLHCGSSAVEEASSAALAMRHGARIREAYFYNIPAALCDFLPELVELHWTRTVLNIPSLTQSFALDGHPKLRILRVSSPTPTLQSRRKGTASQNAMWKSLLTRSVTRQKFPALEQVHVVEGRQIWPANERDTNKSMWPSLAEELAQNGVTLFDHEGRAWRRRLQ